MNVSAVDFITPLYKLFWICSFYYFFHFVCNFPIETVAAVLCSRALVGLPRIIPKLKSYWGVGTYNNVRHAKHSWVMNLIALFIFRYNKKWAIIFLVSKNVKWNFGVWIARNITLRCMSTTKDSTNYEQKEYYGRHIGEWTHGNKKIVINKMKTVACKFDICFWFNYSERRMFSFKKYVISCCLQSILVTAQIYSSCVVRCPGWKGFQRSFVKDADI